MSTKVVVVKEKRKKQKKQQQPKVVVIQKQKQPKPHRASAAAAMAKVPKLARSMETTASRVVKSIMNPSSGGMRMATINDCNPTSLVDLHCVIPCNTTTYAGNYTTFPSGVSYMAVFRDPLRSMVYFRPNIAPFSYRSVFPGGVIGFTFDNSNAALAGIETPVQPLYYSNYSGSTPHGQVLFCGEVEQRQGYVWIDAGVSSVFTVHVTSTLACACGIRVYQNKPSGDVDVGYANLVLVAGVSQDFTMTASSVPSLSEGGYLRFSVLVSTNCILTGYSSVSATAYIDSFAHVSPVGVVNHLPQLCQARVNAVSLLVSNGAAAQYNDGFLQAINMSPGSPWTSLVGESDLSGLAVDVNYFSGVFKKGCYTFLKPSDQEDIDFYDYVKMDNGGALVSECSFPLYRSRYAMVRVQSNAYGSPASYPGLEYILNQSLVIEFQTNDMWFDAEIPQESCLEVEKARDILRRIPNFYENTTHLQMLANAARSAGGFLKRHSAKIGGALSLLFPKFSPVFSALAGAI